MATDLDSDRQGCLHWTSGDHYADCPSCVATGYFDPPMPESAMRVIRHYVSRITELEAGVERLRGALENIAGSECILLDGCPTDDQCPSCEARAALAPRGEES